MLHFGSFMTEGTNRRPFGKRLGNEMRVVRQRTRGARSLRLVAAAIGEHHSVLSRWERGELEVKVVDLIRFATACGVEPAEVLEGVAIPPAEQLVLGLEPVVGRKVLDLVEVLRKRRLHRSYRKQDQVRRSAR